uniref:nuclear transport factor 2 family protein n=1 Tax=Thaumasiovibrio occultus TaxID=1891184 RepID=UPI000B35D6DB|nr:nuclear transport factor 2 family protein [Thaumasiovibrio occultus]
MVSTATRIESGLDRFIQIYGSLDKHNLAQLNTIYHEEVVFEDPAHRIEGLENLIGYFEQLYSNIVSCHFDIHHALGDDAQGDHQMAYLQWTMTFAHPRVAKGATRTLEGCSQITFKDGKVIHHHDFFDMGAMLYEGLPLIGKVITMIKARLGQ